MNLGFYYSAGNAMLKAQRHFEATGKPTTIYQMAGAYHIYEGNGPGAGRFGHIVKRYPETETA